MKPSQGERPLFWSSEGKIDQSEQRGAAGGRDQGDTRRAEKIREGDPCHGAEQGGTMGLLHGSKLGGGLSGGKKLWTTGRWVFIEERQLFLP